MLLTSQLLCFCFCCCTPVPTKVIGQAMGTVKKYAQVSGENYSSGAATMQVSIVPGGTPPSHPNDQRVEWDSRMS
jgi:hypothetical protein